MNRRLTCLTPLAALWLLGCASTPADRIADDRAAFDSLPPAKQQQIRGGQIAVGDTPEMVRLALGDPDAVESRTTANGSQTIWRYRKHSPLFSFGFGLGGFSRGFGSGVGVSTTTGGAGERLRVTFEDGRVSTIDQALQRN